MPNAVRESRLREIEDRILAETRGRQEMLVALDEAGRTLLEKRGVLGEVRLSEQEMAMLRGAADVLTHNHPSGGGIGVADFGLAVELNVREIVAFGSEYRYRLRRTERAWPPLDAALDRLDRLREEIRASLQARVDAGSLDPRAASLRFWHEVWVRFARGAAVDYVRERR